MKKLLASLAIIVALSGCARRTYTTQVDVERQNGKTEHYTLEKTTRGTPQIRLKNNCLFFDGKKITCGVKGFTIVTTKSSRIVTVQH